MPRKDDIRMSPEEIASYLREGHTMTLVTNGARGFPHAVAMFYAIEDDLTVNGEIVDQGGPGTPAGAIPSLSEWSRLLLGLLIMALEVGALGRRKSRDARS